MATSNKKVKVVSQTNDTSGFYFLLILFLGLPLVMATSLLDYTLLPRQMFIAIWTICAALFFRKHVTKTAPINSIIVGFACIIVLHLIPVLTGVINPIESMAVLSKYLGILSFGWIFYILYKSGVFTIQSILKAFLVYAAVSSVIPLFQIIGSMVSGDLWEDIYVIKGTFSHKNLLSINLFLCLPFLIAARVYLRRNGSHLATILLMLCVFEIFLLRTRGVWLATAAGSLAFLSGWIITKNTTSFKLNKTLIGISLGIAVILVLGLFAMPEIKQGVLNKANINNRIEFWNHSADMIKDNPMGVGAGNWKLHFPKYGLNSFENTVQQGITHIQRPHNDFLWLAAEGTVLSGIIYIALFIISFLRAFNNLKTSVDKNESVLNSSILMGLTGYAVFSFADFPLERIESNVLIFIILLLPFYKSGWTKQLKGIVALVLVGSTSAFSLVIAYQRLKSEKEQVKVLQYNEQRNAQLIIPAANKALSSSYNMDAYANPVVYYRSQGELALQQAKPALASALEAAEVAPYNVVVLNQVGNCYKMAGQLDDALEYYRRVSTISKRMYDAHYSMAEIYLNRKNYPEALRQLYRINPYINTNPYFMQLLARSLKEVRETAAQHGEYKDLVEYLNTKNPQTAPQYVAVYKEFRGSSFLTPDSGLR